MPIKLLGPASGSANFTLTGPTGQSVDQTATLPNTTATLATVSNLGLRNLIINGKMDIAQRGTSFAAASSYTLDRWEYGNTSAGVVTITQNSDVPSSNEFLNSFRIAVTTADASVAAGDAALLQQSIEGYLARNLIGRTFIISFWVRSTKTGTHCLSIRNSGGDRTYIATYTINSPDTWEYKTVTITGGLITAGTWNWTSGRGMAIAFTLMAGTTYQTTAGAWQTGLFYGTSAQANVLDSTSNIFAVTGVQIEVGEVATPFEHRPHGLEVLLCQRYYQEVGIAAGGELAYQFYSNGAGVAYYHTYPLPVEMRATPTGTAAGTFSFTNVTSHVVGATSKNSFRISVTATAAGNYFWQNSGSGSKYTFSAEL